MKVALLWTYHPQFDEVFEIDDPRDPQEICDAINARKEKIQSSVPGVSTEQVKQRASIFGEYVRVTCE